MTLYPKSPENDLMGRLFLMTKGELAANGLADYSVLAGGFFTCMFKLFGEEKAEATIFVCEEVAASLTEEEVKAVILHESGHIYNGDIYVAEEIEGAALELIVSVEKEIAADAYALRYTSKNSHVSALNKLADMFCIDKTTPSFKKRLDNLNLT